MPDDRRLDLNSDLDKVASDLLKDVEAAAKEVKQRKAQDREKDRRSAMKEKDRKTSVIVIAIAAVLLIAIASWLTFGRQPSGTGTAPQNVVTPQHNSRIRMPASNFPRPKVPVRPAAPAQHNAQPSNDQPYDDGQPGQ